MRFVLSIKTHGVYDLGFDSVSDAISAYSDAQRLIGAWQKKYNAVVNLRCSQKGTFVELYPGITVKEAAQELESTWEWRVHDCLSVRQVLKERYRTAA